MRKTLAILCLCIATVATTGCDLLEAESKPKKEKHTPTTQAADEIVRSQTEKKSESKKEQEPILGTLKEIKGELVKLNDGLASQHREICHVKSRLAAIEKENHELKEEFNKHKDRLDGLEARLKNESNGSSVKDNSKQEPVPGDASRNDQVIWHETAPALVGCSSPRRIFFIRLRR